MFIIVSHREIAVVSNIGLLLALFSR